MKVFSVLVAIVALSLSAFAGRNQQHVSTDSSLGDLITMCERLERNPQIKKFGAEVTCRGHKTFWTIDKTYNKDLRNEMVVRSEVTMKGDRYRVNEFSKQLKTDPSAAECNKYKEMRQDYLPVTVKLNSCAELRDLEQTGRTTFCQNHLDEAPFENEGLATGRAKDTCN